MIDETKITSYDSSSIGIKDDEIDKRLKHFVGIILIISLILKLLFFTYGSILNETLNGFCYSEFLINYQGGFVRRGLLGEILYQFRQIYSFPVKELIFCICCLTYFGVSVYFFRQFKRHKLCWWLLLSPLFLNFTLFIVRKDYILYAFLIIITYLLSYSSRDILYKSLACLLVILSFLIHEAFLFWGFVLYALLLSTDKRHKKFNYFLIGIPLISVAIITYSKGTLEVAQSIVSSWNSILPNQPLELTHENSIGAISWDALQTFIFHLKLNVSSQTGGGGIVLIPLLLIATYYLFTNYMIYFSNGSAENRNNQRFEVSLLFPVFCISLIPMFTILSCDTGRVFQYATISTFCAFLILPQERIMGMFPEWYKTTIRRFNNWLDCRFPSTRISLIALLMILAVEPCYFSLNTSWCESVIGSIIFYSFRIAIKLAKIFIL